MCNSIAKEQSAKSIREARSSILQVLKCCVDPSLIFNYVLNQFISSVRDYGDSFKREIIQNAAFYSKRCVQGSKDIMHLEAFICKIALLIHAANIKKNSLVK